MNRRLKDWEPTEFPFSSFSHTLRANERKENHMSAITITLFLLIRAVIPFGLLIVLGEWVRRREANYWLKR
jgi:hypothetical protein